MLITLLDVTVLLSDALTMILPKSKNIKFPNTIDEAEWIENEDKLEV